MARSIPISKLKAYESEDSALGRQDVADHKHPVDFKAIRFSSVKRIGKAFKLLRAAGHSPSGFVGGVSTEGADGVRNRG